MLSDFIGFFFIVQPNKSNRVSQHPCIREKLFGLLWREDACSSFTQMSICVLEEKVRNGNEERNQAKTEQFTTSMSTVEDEKHRIREEQSPNERGEFNT